MQIKRILKKCSKCGIEKPLKHFHKDKYGKYGVGYSCKECRKQNKPKDQYLPNRVKSKECKKCGEIFEPKSNRQIWCEPCGIVEKEIKRKSYMTRYHQEHYEKIGYSHLVGENANAYKSGIGLYPKMLKDDKCNRCGSQKFLLTHHKDRNRENNKDENLERLCKACHQKEHMIKDETGKYVGSK
jgi:ribosomal protein S27AE